MKVSEFMRPMGSHLAPRHRTTRRNMAKIEYRQAKRARQAKRNRHGVT